MTPSSQALAWRGVLQLCFGAAITFLFFYMLAPFLVPLFLGAVAAIILFPSFEKLQSRWKLPRSFSALLLVSGLNLGILLPFAFAVYNASDRFLRLLGSLKLPTAVEGEQQLSAFDLVVNHPALATVLSKLSRFFPVDEIWVKDQLLQLVHFFLDKTSALLAGFVSGMPGHILSFAIFIVSCFFLLVDGERFLKFLATLAPMERDKTSALFKAFENSCRGVVLSLIGAAVVQGVIVGICFVITGLPNAGFATVSTILMGLVPVVGSAPIWIGATLYLFFKKSTLMGIIMLIGGALVATSDNVVRPWILKGHSEMHPLLALVSVFGAVNLLGATGIFLGPIIAAVFVSFLRIVSLEMQGRGQGIITGDLPA